MSPIYNWIVLFIAKGTARAGAERAGPDNQVPVMRSVNPSYKNDFLHRMTREAGKPPLTNERNTTNITNVAENLKITFAKQNLSIIAKNVTTQHLGSNFTKFPLWL